MLQILLAGIIAATTVRANSEKDLRGAYQLTGEHVKTELQIFEISEDRVRGKMNGVLLSGTWTNGTLKLRSVDGSPHGVELQDDGHGGFIGSVLIYGAKHEVASAVEQRKDLFADRARGPSARVAQEDNDMDDAPDDVALPSTACQAVDFPSRSTISSGRPCRQLITDFSQQFSKNFLKSDLRWAQGECRDTDERPGEFTSGAILPGGATLAAPMVTAMLLPRRRDVAIRVLKMRRENALTKPLNQDRDIDWFHHRFVNKGHSLKAEFLKLTNFALLASQSSVSERVVFYLLVADDSDCKVFMSHNFQSVISNRVNNRLSRTNDGLVHGYRCGTQIEDLFMTPAHTEGSIMIAYLLGSESVRLEWVRKRF